MTRFGWTMLVLLVLAGMAIALTVRVTGPGGGRPQAAAPANATASAVPSSPGALLVPVQGVARTSLTDDWGEARGDGTRVHHAIDILAPRGAPVVAAADGRIEKLFTSVLGGLTVYERSADGGFVYYYAHLDGYVPGLAEGRAVRAGDTLGFVGATGDAAATAPHLHFEVHRMALGQTWAQGEELNPFPILRGGIR